MSTLREAAQQALEALKSVQDHRPNDETNAAITALRAALAQEEQGPVLVVEQEPDYMSRGHFYEGSKSFIDPTEVRKLPIGTKLYTHPPRRDALEQEEQEPVAWQWLDTGHFRKKLPVDAEPGAWNPLYTHPPRREWQGLTTQEATSLTDTVPRGTFYGCDAGTGLGIWIAAVAAAERALKEKNA